MIAHRLYLLFLILLIVVIHGCGTEKTNFKVSGRFEGNEGTPITLIRLGTTANKAIDSTITDANGEFELEGYTGMTEFFSLHTLDDE